MMKPIIGMDTLLYKGERAGSQAQVLRPSDGGGWQAHRATSMKNDVRKNTVTNTIDNSTQ